MMATAVLAMLPPVAVVVLSCSSCSCEVWSRPRNNRASHRRSDGDPSCETSNKTYAGGVEAVKGVSLGIGDGQPCVLVGPSGCGKSTLLRMVAGLETISGGDGRRSASAWSTPIEPADRDIAMVFQNYALYPHMSVYDNMAYGLRNRGMAKPEIDSRVREAARILEIGPMLAAQAEAAVRRPAPARRHGPRHRAPAQGLPVRRAAVEPRRQAARSPCGWKLASCSAG